MPALPRHLATPDLMERAGDPAFYDEPELARTSPPAARRTPSGLAPEGCLPSAAPHDDVTSETLCAHLTHTERPLHSLKDPLLTSEVRSQRTCQALMRQ